MKGRTLVTAILLLALAFTVVAGAAAAQSFIAVDLGTLSGPSGQTGRNGQVVGCSHTGGTTHAVPWMHTAIDCRQCPTSCAAPVNGTCGDCPLVVDATCTSGDLRVANNPTATPTITPMGTSTATPTPTPTVAPDTYWDSVKLLLHMDATPFTESKQNLTVSNIGSVDTTTAATGFSNGANFTATSGQRLCVPDSSDWTVGTSAYTVEMRAKFTTLPSSGNRFVLAGTQSTNTGWLWYLTNDSGSYKMGLFHDRTNSGITVWDVTQTNALTLSTDTWYTLAYVHTGSGDDDYYQDGVRVYGFSHSHGFSDNSDSVPLCIGGNDAGGSLLNGVVDEVRITKGVARYGGDYTPASQPFADFGPLTPTPTPSGCVGDCNTDQRVTADDILTVVTIALGNRDIGTCGAGDANFDHAITVDEILKSVNNALAGCPK